MTNKDYCDITVVLDRSGSMANLKNDVEKGFDSWIKEQRNLPGKCSVTLIQFDTVDVETLYENKDVKEVPSLTLVPRGGTPLLDAVGNAITQTGNRLRKLPENHRPGRVLFVIITDGEENSSNTFTKERIKEMVEHQTNEYAWDFVFLGVGIDAFEQGHNMGISRMSTRSYAYNTKGVGQTFCDLGTISQSVRGGGQAVIPNNDKIGGS